MGREDNSVTGLPEYLQPSTKTYLLKTDTAERMNRWRSAADAQGYASFAEFARTALDQATTTPSTASGRWVGWDVVVLSQACYAGGHPDCDGCDCSCHKTSGS